MILFIWCLTIFLTLYSFFKNKERTIEALWASVKTFKRLLPALLAMMFLVGFILAIFPKESIAQIFNQKGFYGFVVVSLIGAIVTIPGPIAFPLAGALLQMGVKQDLLASFITTLTMVGIASSPLEISYFGKRFTLLRQVLSFVSAILIGQIMRGLL